MSEEQPGRPAIGSPVGRSMMAIVQLLARPRALRAIWELRAGPLDLADLAARAETSSPDDLAAPLADLIEAGIVARDAAGTLHLTAVGTDLVLALAPLQRWALEWGRRRASPL